VARRTAGRAGRNSTSRSRLKVWVAMGSDSDLPVMEEALRTLREFDIPYEVDVTSAHRTPDATARLAKNAERRGFGAIIVGAGHAAHLGGVVAAHTTLPVIGVPLPSSSLQGMDALLATVQMPGGVPVATMAIGKAGAANAGILAAQILATADPDLRRRLHEHKTRLAAKVLEKNRALRKAPPAVS
jgi:phosphoribosylaminoimidazole carboxylase PurE protein